MQHTQNELWIEYNDTVGHFAFLTDDETRTQTVSTILSSFRFIHRIKITNCAHNSCFTNSWTTKKKSKIIYDYTFIWEMSTIRTILEYGRKKGVFEITDLESVAMAFFFALKGPEYPWTINLPLEEIEKSVDVLIDILLKGIRKS